MQRQNPPRGPPRVKKFPTGRLTFRDTADEPPKGISMQQFLEMYNFIVRQKERIDKIAGVQTEISNDNLLGAISTAAEIKVNKAKTSGDEKIARLQGRVRNIEQQLKN